MRTGTLTHRTSSPRSQRGSAILIILTIIGIGAAFLLVSALNKATQQIERDKITADVLTKAKDALIGYAATYRDSQPGNVFGYLPCPAIDGNGIAGNCGSKDVTLIGLLPWKTLGLPPLRDSSGECLWYAVSGSFKNSPKTTLMNWDTAGQLIVNDAGSATLANGVAAVIFSPRSVIGSQNRTPIGTTECGGNTTVAAYLDGSDPIYSGTVPVAGANTTLTMANAASIAGGTNNDRGLWITPDEIFKRIKQRNDFKSPALPAPGPNGDVNNLITSVAACLKAQATLPAPVSINFSSMAETGGVTAGSLITGRVPQNYVDTYCSNALTGIPAWSATWNGWWVNGINQTGKNFNDNWQDNLLYAKCNSGQCLSVNGSPCTAVLIFSGERDATTSPAQNRATAANKNIRANYLEGNPLSLFNSGAPTTFTGASTHFSIVNVNTPATADVVACINPSSPPPGSTQVTFASNLGSFVTAGAGVTTSVPTQSVNVTAAGGSSGGCLWYPTSIPLSGKTLRAYYTFTFTNADPFGGADLGNGFTLSLVRGDVGSPTACGTQSYMGVLAASTLWGNMSYILETDIHRDGSVNDPAGNHTAIMANGNLAHSAAVGGNGYTTAACNGSAQGCLYSPANTFEESPAPLNHSQRIEIHTGCDSACTTCNSSGAYAQIKVWTDCASCSDTASDFASTPKTSRCTVLDASMNSFYFGFTGGFSSASGGQGVTLRNLDLRTQ